VAVGQDGLIANGAKYLDRQPVVGINPDLDASGTLARASVGTIDATLMRIASGAVRYDERTLIEAQLRV
jgi:NAD kinase